MPQTWSKSIYVGVVSGAIWGCISILCNALTGVFPFEHTLFQNIISFSAGGIVLGIVISSFLTLTHNKIPFSSVVLKAVFVSVCFWIILRTGGSILSSIESERYNVMTYQTLQGLALSVILGCLLGLFWKASIKEV